MADNWKKVLSQCGSHGGLRLIQNRLFATAGSFIDNCVIQNIMTSPENVATLDGGSFRFPVACEITNIDLYGTKVYEPNNATPFVSRDSAFPALNNQYIKTNISREAIMSKPQQEAVPNGLSSTIYDSMTIPGGLSNFMLGTKSKLVRSLKSNGKDYFTVKRMGVLSLPMSMIGENKDYTVVLTMKRLSGNGKVNIGIGVGTEQVAYTPIIAELAFTETRTSVRTGTKPFPGEFFKVNIAILEDGLGEVLISRIVVIESNFSVNKLSDAANVQFTHTPRHTPPVTPAIALAQQAVPITREQVSNYVSMKCFDPYSDGIKNSTKNSAIIHVTRQELPETFDANIIIEPLTYSARQWVGKSYSLLRGAKIVDGPSQMSNVDKTADTADITFGSLGFLKPSKRIFVEEWNTRQRPSEEDVALLEKCETIITPSFINFQILKQALPDKYILCMPRFWPAYGVPEITSGRYYLYFEKFPKVTEMLIDCWKPTYQMLYVVGSTATLKQNIQHLSEYADYSLLLSYILGAETVIDISDNTNYMSGINNIAIHNNVNLITNNLAYFANDYANVKFVNSTIDGNANLVIDQAVIQSALDARMAFGQVASKPLSPNYLALFKENISQLTGKPNG